MAKIECEVTTTTVEGDHGPVEGVCVTCGECGHEVEVAGTSDRSVRRGLATLRDDCPKGQRNYYVDADDSD
jgi:hypothetical protein